MKYLDINLLEYVLDLCVKKPYNAVMKDIREKQNKWRCYSVINCKTQYY